MRVMQTFRFELDPNQQTRVALAKHVGAARFAYNWGLARCREAMARMARGERIPSAMELHKEWNVWKRENAPWWTEVSKCTPQEAFRDLERAFRNWREGRADFPCFKRKKVIEDNNDDALQNGAFRRPDHCFLHLNAAKRKGDRLLWAFGRMEREVHALFKRQSSPSEETAMAKTGNEAHIAVVGGFETVQIQWREIAVARWIPEGFPTSLFRVIPDAVEWPAVLIVATPDGVTAVFGATDWEANPQSVSLFGFGEPDHVRFTPRFAEVVIRPRARDFSGRLLFGGDFLVASDVRGGRDRVEIHVSVFWEAPDLRKHPLGSLPDPFLIARASRKASALSILNPGDSAKRTEGLVAFRDGEVLTVGLVPRRILRAAGIRAEKTDPEES